MNFRKLRLDLARHHVYWTGSIAAVLGLCMIAVLVVKTSQEATLDDPSREQSSRLLEKASGSGNALDEAPVPESSPGPSPAAMVGTTTTVASPSSIRTTAPSAPAVKAPLPKISPVVENRNDPYSRFNMVQGPNGPQPGSGPDVRCDIWNNVPPLPVKRGQTFTMGCTVISKYGFSAPSSLSCGVPTNRQPLPLDVAPGPITCSFDPPVVTPPPDGVAHSTLTMVIPPDLPYDWYDYGFKVDSPGASLFMPPVKPINLDVARPDFSASCGDNRMTVFAGQGWTDLACQVTVPAGFDDSIEVVQSNMGGPDGRGAEFRTDVTRLEFGPEGGTEQFVLSVRWPGAYSGTQPFTISLWNSSKSSKRVHYLEVTIDYKHPE